MLEVCSRRASSVVLEVWGVEVVLGVCRVRGVRGVLCSGCVVLASEHVSCSLQEVCRARFRRRVVLSFRRGVHAMDASRLCSRCASDQVQSEASSTYAATKSNAQRAQHAQQTGAQRARHTQRAQHMQRASPERSELNLCSDQVQGAASSTREAAKSRAQRAQHIQRPSPERSELNMGSDQVQGAASSTRVATKSRAQRAQHGQRPSPERSELNA